MVLPQTYLTLVPEGEEAEVTANALKLLLGREPFMYVKEGQEPLDFCTFLGPRVQEDSIWFKILITDDERTIRFCLPLNGSVVAGKPQDGTYETVCRLDRNTISLAVRRNGVLMPMSYFFITSPPAGVTMLYERSPSMRLRVLLEQYPLAAVCFDLLAQPQQDAFIRLLNGYLTSNDGDRLESLVAQVLPWVLQARRRLSMNPNGTVSYHNDTDRWTITLNAKGEAESCSCHQFCGRGEFHGRPGRCPHMDAAEIFWASALQ